MFFLSSLSYHGGAIAQEYGFEWINYSQEYYKIPIAKDGIYRISYDQLVNAGLPVNSIDPRKIQIFHRGVEQAIVVEGELDAIFNSQDYILFYGTRNDGSLDKNLYVPAEAQPNPYYNLFSDTTAFFLTWKYSGENGKRVQAFYETNTSGIPAEQAHFPVIRQINANNYFAGRKFLDYTNYSQFDQGEGWTGSAFQENQQRDFTLSGIEDIVVSSGSIELKILLQGRSDVAHRAEIFVGKSSASLRSIGVIDYTNFEPKYFTSSITGNDINANGEVVVRVKCLGQDGNDLMSVTLIELKFPQTLDQNGLAVKKYILKENTSGKSFLIIDNIEPGTTFFDITNKDNIKRIRYDYQNGAARLIVPQTQIVRTLIATTEYYTCDLEEVVLQPLDISKADYYIISHPLLMQSAGSYANAVTAYAEYRSTVQGGSHHTLIADILQLYDQFSYGEITPLAIYNFVRWLKDKGKPEYLFFIGKGVSINYNPNRVDTLFLQNLVPTAGYPASDIIFSSGMDGFTYQPSIATGRITAKTPQEVIHYLEKVKAREALPYDDLWRKRVLHLSGGLSDYELRQFRSFLQSFEYIAEDHYLGGKVKTIQKNTRAATEFINIAEEINNGVNLVTFFGHSSPNVTDIDIGYVSDPTLGYNNKNKYPVFLMNGCNVGDFFLPFELFGEDWILTPDKGAIGFIAHTSFGYPFDLRRYSLDFYETGYGDSVYIEKPLGKIQQESIRRFSQYINGLPNRVAAAQQMFLLGDPAIDLFGAKAPDYAIEANNVFITSYNANPVTALSDSFAINVIVKNYGKAPDLPLNVGIIRNFEDGNSIAWDTTFSAVLYQDTLQIIVKNEGFSQSGNNEFIITIDEGNAIEELNESNNSMTYDYFLKLYSTINLLPYNFATVDKNYKEIVVQSTELLAPERSFIVEMDTTSTFNSPFLQSVSQSSRLLLEWAPQWIGEDTLTYFVRSKFQDTAPGEVDEWYVSSFTKLHTENVFGFALRTNDQLSKNTYNDLTFDPVNGRLLFKETVREVKIKTSGAAAENDYEESVVIDGLEYLIFTNTNCRDNTINLIAFDRNNANPYAPISFTLQNPRSCGRQPQVINSFLEHELFSGDGNDLQAVINKIEEGDSVILFSIGNAGYANWPQEVKTALEQVGVASAFWETLTNGEPVIIKGKKGAAPGSAHIIKSDNPQSIELSLNSTFTGVAASGEVATPVIGPAVSWNTITVDAATEGVDEVSYRVEALNLRGEVQGTFNYDNLSADISSINADENPYLRIRILLQDEVNRTPPLINGIYVNFTPAPEGVLLAHELDGASEMQEGDTLSLKFGFYNPSIWNFTDSLEVLQGVNNVASKRNISPNFKIAPPLRGDTVHFEVAIPTRNRVGENNFILSVNDRIVPEQHYENNSINKNNFLKVTKDQAAPLIDVRFDGAHIFDRDIISPNPLITVVLKDENPYLTKQDTAGIQILLKNCEDCPFIRYNFSSDQLTARADTENNEYIIEFTPGPLEDGIYTLRIQASDVSGNMAGGQPYEISFEVINELTVTNFYPYPNPFSTKVKFVFTLTGNELPDEMMIQIMTITGKVVKEIMLSDFGVLRIGNNISDYAWDGKDEFGDQLGNGVYLYKVTMRKNGTELKQRATAGDDLFKNGYGKIYLLR